MRVIFARCCKRNAHTNSFVLSKKVSLLASTEKMRLKWPYLKSAMIRLTINFIRCRVKLSQLLFVTAHRKTKGNLSTILHFFQSITPFFFILCTHHHHHQSSFNSVFSSSPKVAEYTSSPPRPPSLLPSI